MRTLFALALVACAAAPNADDAAPDPGGAPDPSAPPSGGGASIGSPTFGPADGGDAAPQGGGGGSGRLVATVRDFKLYAPGDPTTNPDFEDVPSGNGPWDDRGIVSPSLGADGKPVYAHPSGTVTTHGRASFDQWYRDVPGVNVRVDLPIDLAPNGDGSFGFDSEKTGVPLSPQDPTKMFFPIDDGSPYATPFGNQGDPHNYSFTVELHTTFVYRGGEYFRFRGDDDVFVFIGGKLAIDLGGIHSAEPQEVQIDTLGLVKGQSYPLDFFSAERHKIGSNVLFTTTLDLKSAPPR